MLYIFESCDSKVIGSYSNFFLQELLVWYGNAYGSILQSLISIHGENEVTTPSKEENTMVKEKTIKIRTDTGDLLDIVDEEGLFISVIR